MNVDEVSWASGLRLCVEIDVSDSHQVFDVVEYFVGCGDLFRELAFVDHASSAEEGEDEYVSEECGGGVHFDGVEGVEELDAVELEDQFAEYLFAQEGGFLAAVEEDDPEQFEVLAAGHLRHEELEVVDVEFAVEELLLAGRVLAAGDPAHVLLADYLAEWPLFLALLLDHYLEFSGAGAGDELFNGVASVSVFKPPDF